MKVKHVIVDGSNIATEGRDAPSLAQLDEAVQAFIEEYSPKFVTVVVDATFPNRIDRKERKTYEDAVNANELVTPPAGAIGRGDAFILQIARRADAAILSNDSFQEFHGEYPWLFDKGRLIGGKPVPHVGWVFMDRAPVRGPTSRRAVSEARKGVKAATKAAGAVDLDGAEPKAPRTRRTRAKAASAPPAVKANAQAESGAPAAQATAVAEAAAELSHDGRPPGRAPRGVEPYNEALPFIEFVAQHPVGSEVDAVIERFSSHGAYVMVGAARGYLPLQNLADPAPRSAKEALSVGDERRFVVVSIDPPRRGIDLAVPGVVEVPAATATDLPAADVDDTPAGAGTARPTAKRSGARKPATAPAPVERAPADETPPVRARTARGRKASTVPQAASPAAASPGTGDEAPVRTAPPRTTRTRKPAAAAGAEQNAVGGSGDATVGDTGATPAPRAAPAKAVSSKAPATKKAGAAAKKSAATKNPATTTTAAKKGAAAKKGTAKKAATTTEGAAKKPAATKDVAAATRKGAAPRRGAAKRSAARKEEGAAAKTAAEGAAAKTAAEGAVEAQAGRRTGTASSSAHGAATDEGDTPAERPGRSARKATATTLPAHDTAPPTRSSARTAAEKTSPSNGAAETSARPRRRARSDVVDDLVVAPEGGAVQGADGASGPAEAAGA